MGMAIQSKRNFENVLSKARTRKNVQYSVFTIDNRTYGYNLSSNRCSNAKSSLNAIGLADVRPSLTAKITLEYSFRATRAASGALASTENERNKLIKLLDAELSVKRCLHPSIN